MKIEVGKTYWSVTDIEEGNSSLSAGTSVKVLSLDEDIVVFMKTFGRALNYEWDTKSFVKFFKEEDVPKQTFGKQESAKPAHYDTEIDTLAFAKANFSQEQVEGFMRINAVKYIQRYKAKNGVDDVRKAVVYLNMLIEHLEEEEK